MKIRQVDIKGEIYDIEPYENPIPVGSVFPFAGVTAPEGFLLCNGQEVSRITYSKLYAVLGDIYGSGDGSTTFNLPDYSEVVLVGAGASSNPKIRAHDIYEVGEFKDDQMQGHRHTVNTFLYKKGTNGPAGNYFDYGLIETSNPINDSVNGTPRTGSTTHGKQIGINYIIKV